MTCVLSAFHVSACAPRLIKCDAVVHDNVRAFSVLVLLLRFGVTSPFWRYFSVLALLLRFGVTSPRWHDCICTDYAASVPSPFPLAQSEGSLFEYVTHFQLCVFEGVRSGKGKKKKKKNTSLLNVDLLCEYIFIIGIINDTCQK
ncbi:hypothetical protein POVWA2_006210 [Plasmodium ovale wallikeri]|uniref:Uncharacterized protein n=1 Tax=Plasmodium ovale wallikeri TaxID=864142 RepID=A0A1A8YJV8_PLAOA|nr:hypothetical protein POVWA2_006210 [Plasmodium ovale wallikeri]